MEDDMIFFCDYGSFFPQRHFHFFTVDMSQWKNHRCKKKSNLLQQNKAIVIIIRNTQVFVIVMSQSICWEKDSLCWI